MSCNQVAGGDARDYKGPVRIHQILKEKHVLTWFKKLDDNFSGMAIRIKGNESSSDKYFMLINTALSYAKQRFTACHELYHLLYQKDFKVSQNNAGLFNKKEEEEYNADVFAAYLLLPEMGLKELVPADEQQVDKITLATLLKVEQNSLLKGGTSYPAEGLEMDYQENV